MAQPIKEYSADRIGKTWGAADHAYLCHVLDRIDETVVRMIDALNKHTNEPEMEVQPR